MAEDDDDIELTNEEKLAVRMLVREGLINELPGIAKFVRGCRALGWVGNVVGRIVMLAGSLAAGYTLFHDWIAAIIGASGK